MLDLIYDFVVHIPLNVPIIITMSALFLALIMVIYEFIRTPRAEKYRWVQEPKELGPDYAPMYSMQERFTMLRKALIWAVPIIIVVKFWLKDWISNFADNAPCLHYGPINGVQVFTYSMLVLPFLALTIYLISSEGKRTIQIFKLKQWPLPNEKVLQPTKYVYGIRAQFQSIMLIFAMIACIGLTIFSIYSAHELTKKVVTCKEYQTRKNY